MAQNEKVGKTVFTANARTKTVDEWECIGVFPTKDETLLLLTRGKQQLFLPDRCVFLHMYEAVIAAAK